jgi:hypothetical protein
MSNGTRISKEDHAFFCRCNWLHPPPLLVNTGKDSSLFRLRREKGNDDDREERELAIVAVLAGGGASQIQRQKTRRGSSFPILFGAILSHAYPLYTVYSRARICKHLRSPGIDSEESISPSYVAWRAGQVVVPAR